MDENKVIPIQNEMEDEVIVVKEGIKRVRIQNEYGEDIGVFMFNPTDINIVNRYNEVADQFKEVIKPLEKASITASGEAADVDSVEIVNRAEEKMIELMDYMLRCNSRKAFFEKTHLFTPSDGVFYCENVLNAIGEYITAKFDAEVKKIDTRVGKHTHGYRTGKHRKGDR